MSANNPISLPRSLQDHPALPGSDGAERIYWAIGRVRDALDPETRKSFATVFEWAREGIAQEQGGDLPPELARLQSAFSYARDVLVISTPEKR